MKMVNIGGTRENPLSMVVMVGLVLEV